VAIQRDLADIVPMRGHRLFSGVVSRDAFPENLSQVAFRLMGCRYGDCRAWDSIAEWADEIADELGTGISSSRTADVDRR
jgi:menaquinone-dependent protoporphyrinogen oxidase